jgi:hypothetical protein
VPVFTLFQNQGTTGSVSLKKYKSKDEKSAMGPYCSLYKSTVLTFLCNQKITEEKWAFNRSFNVKCLSN